MDKDYLKFQEKEFIRIWEDFKLVGKELSSFEYNVLISKLISDMPYVAENSQVFALNPFMLPLLGIKQLIEYKPIVKYIGVNISYLVKYYVPEVELDIYYPEILDNKFFLVAAHLASGGASAMMMPEENIIDALLFSVASSLSLTARYASQHYLSEIEDTIESKSQSESITESSSLNIAKHCAISLATYILPNIATCALAKAVMPGVSCSIIDLSLKAGIAGAECLSFILNQNKMIDADYNINSDIDSNLDQNNYINAINPEDTCDIIGNYFDL